MLTKHYFVYILASASKRLYIGVTNNLHRRMLEHRGEGVETFAKKYAITKLVYFEHTQDVNSAIAREKHMKGWKREKKIALIESCNLKWKDLYPGLFGGEETLSDSSDCREDQARQSSE